MIKINTMVRNINDEKSKTTALKVSEETLTAKIEDFKSKIDKLEDKNDGLSQNLIDLEQ